MNTVIVKYVKNIEDSLGEYLLQGYDLLLFEKSANHEVRFYLGQIDNPLFICLARQFWDEMYPDAFEDGDIELPEPFIEMRTKSEEEFMEMYFHLTSSGLMETVPNDELSDAAVLKLKDGTTRIVCPGGYTWE